MLTPVEVEILCTHCLCIFREPLGRTITCNRFCSEECRRERRREGKRRRDRSREADPARVLYCRERNRAWAVKHRNVTRSNPWLLGAPPFAPTLPCVALDIAVDPLPKWPMQMRNMRGIHGAITGLLANAIGLRHQHRQPTFATRLHDTGKLRVIVWDESAAGLYDGAYNGVLWDRPTVFRVEDAVEVSSPKVLKRGHQRVRLTAITPVSISKDGHSVPCVRPEGDVIRRSLSGSLLERFGLQRLAGEVRCEVLDIRTEPSHVPLGGKYRSVPGWTGTVDLEVNAPALWLLLAAEKVGFGSRTAFGFGQIHVEVIE